MVVFVFWGIMFDVIKGYSVCVLWMFAGEMTMATGLDGVELVALRTYIEVSDSEFGCGQRIRRWQIWTYHLWFGFILCLCILSMKSVMTCDKNKDVSLMVSIIRQMAETTLVTLEQKFCTTVFFFLQNIRTNGFVLCAFVQNHSAVSRVIPQYTR